jgi:outer membrane protein assembly factor BamE (lipoprotein component of BamABCDE complex)
MKQKKLKGINALLISLPLCVAVASIISGCVIVPTPGTYTTNLDEYIESTIQIGVTTKEEVIELLGEPNLLTYNATVFEYNWEKGRTFMFATVGGGGTFETTSANRLEIEFDQNGRVVDTNIRKNHEAPQIYSTREVKFDKYYKGVIPEERLAIVTVLDKRTELGKHYYWTGLGGDEISRITFIPSETEIVKIIVETELTEALAALKISHATEFSCELNTFEIHNTATAVSFDFVCEIDFELIQDTNRYHITATKDHRAYRVPEGKFISKLITGCFEDMDDDFRRAAQEIARNE